MSKLIDRLNRLSKPEPQPMGFRTAPSASPKPKIQLIASLAQEDTEKLAGHVAGADAGLLRISKVSSGAKALQKICQSVSDIPWGGQADSGNAEDIKQLTKAGCDFLVIPASTTRVVVLQNGEVGKILEVEASLDEGLLRGANDLPIDAVLIAGEKKEDYFLTWHHLMLFRRFADLLTKPLLVSIPSNITADELQAVWEAGVKGVVVDVTASQQDRMKELRQIIDKLDFPSPRKREKVEPMLPRPSREPSRVTEQEEEEEE